MNRTSFWGPMSHYTGRFRRVFHFTSLVNLLSIKKGKKLVSGRGSRGSGIYLTSHRPRYSSLHEIKTAVRNPSIPDQLVAAALSLNWDLVCARYINAEYNPVLGIVYIPVQEGGEITLDDLEAEYDENVDFGGSD